MRPLYSIQGRAGRGRASGASALFLAAALLAHVAGACSAEAPANVLAEFDVAPRGDLIALPVTIDSRTYPFAFDTRASGWAFDESLRNLLGTFADRVLLRAPDANQVIERYAMPGLRVGPLHVTAGKAACLDLFSLCTSDGHEVYGVVPVALLRDKIFRIDFERGKFQLLRSVPSDPGDRLELIWKRGAPWLLLEVPGAGKEEFLVASTRGWQTGSLRKALFDDLVSRGRMRQLGSAEDSACSLTEWMAPSPQARLDHFVVAQFHHKGAIFSASDHSEIGLGYLSRYNVTFDFAHSALYLKPGKEYSRPDRYGALAGLLIGAVSESVTVFELREGGPAQEAGLDVADEIIKVDDTIARQTSTFELARLLATPGRRKVRFRRTPEDGERETTIVLKDFDDAAAAERRVGPGKDD